MDLRGDPGRPRDLVDDGDGVMREKFPLGVAYRDVDGTERIGTHEKVAKTPGLSDRNILGCGIVVAGVPIGDREYVRVQLAGTALATKSKIEKIQLMLRPESIHALHVLNIFCLQPIFTYWTQHVYPSDTAGLGVPSRFAVDESPAAVVDRALLGVARATHGAFVDSDPIARERLHLPARANGGGLRSLVQSAPAAFAATVAKIAPKLIESKDDQGAVRRGFLDGVAGMISLFGDGSFDGNQDFPWGGPGRLATFVGDRETSYSYEFRFAWDYSRGLAVGDPDGVAAGLPAAEPPRSGLLAQPPENAGLIDDGGSGVPTRPLLGGLQGAVTKEIEKFDARVLDSKIRALAPDDFRRTAYLNLNATSRVWLSVLPDYDNALTNAEFAEVSARYFRPVLRRPEPGLRRGEGPSVRSRAEDGRRIRVRRERGSVSPGGGWTSQHDRIKRAMAESAREMGQEVAMEVYGLDATCLPVGYRGPWRRCPIRRGRPVMMITVSYIRTSGKHPNTIPSSITLSTQAA